MPAGKAMKQAADMENEAEHIERQADIVVSEYKERLGNAIKELRKVESGWEKARILYPFYTWNFTSGTKYLECLTYTGTTEEANKKLELDCKIEARAKEKLKDTSDEIERLLIRYDGRFAWQKGILKIEFPGRSYPQTKDAPEESKPKLDTEKPPSRCPTNRQKPADVVSIWSDEGAAITGACIAVLIAAGVILYNILT